MAIPLQHQLPESLRVGAQPSLLVAESPHDELHFNTVSHKTPTLGQAPLGLKKDGSAVRRKPVPPAGTRPSAAKSTAAPHIVRPEVLALLNKAGSDPAFQEKMAAWQGETPATSSKTSLSSRFSWSRMMASPKNPLSAAAKDARAERRYNKVQMMKNPQLSKWEDKERGTYG